MASSVIIEFTDEFELRYLGLETSDAAAVNHYVDLLEAKGVTLAFPYCSGIESSKLKLRELRVQSGGRPLRVIYAFDPLRQAVLLIGGDKTGDDRFYETFVPKAEALWIKYLAELEE